MEANYCSFTGLENLLVPFELLERFPWLIAVTTQKKFFEGNPRTREEELRHLLSRLGVGELPIVVGHQLHTDHVVNIDNRILTSDYVVIPATDGLITGLTDTVLSIMTADCAPIVLVCDNPRMVAVVHSGWKGTYFGVVSNAISEMINSGADSRNINAWMGPMAMRCCYEVSQEMIESFQSKFTEISESEMINGRNLDLVTINKYHMLTAGLMPSNIFESHTCTIHNHEVYHSYRADKGTQGRIVTAVAIINTDK